MNDGIFFMQNFDYISFHKQNRKRESINIIIIEADSLDFADKILETPFEELLIFIKVAGLKSETQQGWNSFHCTKK